MTHDKTQPDKTAAFRSIPAVDKLADAPALAAWRERLSPVLVTDAARRVIDTYRANLIDAAGNGDVKALSFDDLVERVQVQLDQSQKPPLTAVINATGIIIHTGLGRSPLAAAAVDALGDVAGRYAPVELDLPSGERGKRTHLVRDLLCEITGAEAATVVNNNAAATMLTLAALAKGREVIVSRGELVEIGGSFRLPEVMATSDAVLREVGATNKTRAADYENAINENTAALMKVHTSNYRIEGFTEAATIGELVDIGRRHDLPVIDDVGSGALVDFERYGVRDEPSVRDSVAAGADLVLFSGDKLLGGPQAGIIVGRRAWIDRIDKHPMMRAMRLDKLILAALGATLQLHRDPQIAVAHVPVLAMLTAPVAGLRRRADLLAAQIGATPGVASATVEETTCYLGGGALPTQGVPGVAVRICCEAVSEQELARRLRVPEGDIAPVVARVQNEAVWLELRTLLADQDEQAVKAVRAALG